MPTATSSSVKHQDGIYVTGGQWMNTAFASFWISISHVSLLSLHLRLVLFVFPFLFFPVHQSPSILSASWNSSPFPSARLPLRQGRCLVQGVCLINEEAEFCYRGGPGAHGGLNHQHWLCSFDALTKAMITHLVKRGLSACLYLVTPIKIFLPPLSLPF